MSDLPRETPDNIWTWLVAVQTLITLVIVIISKHCPPVACGCKFLFFIFSLLLMFSAEGIIHHLTSSFWLMFNVLSFLRFGFGFLVLV